ncbi:MAG: hypothetical protein ACJAVN_001758 [Roseivirga sp.]
MTHTFEILKLKVFELLRNELPEVYYYHSFDHTENMLEVAPSYIAYEEINAKDSELLMIAILFHDVGFIDSWKSHEIRGAKIASEYMMKHGCPSDEIQIVENLILATQIPQNPSDILQKIICDVDLDYLGSSDYDQRSELLYKEWLALDIIKDRSDWKRKELDFLKNQKFHTTFGLVNRQPVLNQRIASILANKGD